MRFPRSMPHDPHPEMLSSRDATLRIHSLAAVGESEAMPFKTTTPLPLTFLPISTLVLPLPQLPS